MKKIALLVVLFGWKFTVFSQLNCTTTINSEKSRITTCFHANKTVSTEEIWDADHRFGSIRGIDSKGKELFKCYLRSVGGHASAKLEYFPNGQVSKVYFSDAPDGGIQFHNSTTKFDETGNQIDFSESKYPHETITTFTYDPEKLKQPVVEPVKKQEVIVCATIFTTVYQLQNTTDSRLKITINALPNLAVNKQSIDVVLLPNQTFSFDTILMADQFISAKVYQPVITKVETKSRKNKSIKIIESAPVDAGNQRTFYWFITRS